MTDVELETALKQKIKAGKQLTNSELGLLVANSPEGLHGLLGQWMLESLPKKLYVGLSGRQHKILNEQAQRYDLPIGSGQAVINLYDVIRRFHDMLAEQRTNDPGTLLPNPAAADSFGGGVLNALELSDEEQAYLLLSLDDAKKLALQKKVALDKIKIRRSREELLEKSEVHAVFGILSTVLRQAFEAIQQRWGEEPRQILTDALELCRERLQAEFKQELDLEPEETLRDE